VRQLTDASGAVTLAENYDPFGNTGSSLGSTTTPYGFTGEQADPTGMVSLRARYYSPYLSRFMTRDTWGGNDNQPMSYNLWLYVYGNPVNLSDPSGYYIDCSRMPTTEDTTNCGRLRTDYDIDIYGFVSYRDLEAVVRGAEAVGGKLYSLMCTYFTCKQSSASVLFQAVYGKYTFTYQSNSDVGSFCQRETPGNNIACYNNTGKIYRGLIAHELGHAFSAAMINGGYGNPINDLSQSTLSYINDRGEEVWISGLHWVFNNECQRWEWKWERGYEGYICDHATCVYHGIRWQDDLLTSMHEEFADMFANWVMDNVPNTERNGFTNDAAGNARRYWINTYIFHYLYPLAGTGYKYPGYGTGHR
jgi:RHS repeat-associated protein